MKKGREVVCSVLMAVSLVVAGPATSTNAVRAHSQQQEPQSTTAFVQGRILVQFQPGTLPEQAAQLIAEIGARDVDAIPQLGVHILQLPAVANEEAVAHAFRARPEVAFAELDRIVPPEDLIPNDPSYSGEWHLPRIAAPTAWSATTGSSSVTIAICDTGCDLTHPDLVSKYVPGWNFYDNNSNTSDVYGHGTAVAGTAAAASNNGVGVASVAWGCMIMPLRVSAPDGTATYSAIASAVTYAADHGARVANVSYLVSDSSTVSSAGQYLQTKGGILTVAAGNYSTFDSSPDNPYMLVVSATDQNDVLAPFSNTGNNVDLSAPGVTIETTTNGGGYGAGTGTSASAPIVAGVAALVISVKPSLTPSQLTSLLEQSADDLGPAGWDPSYGWGRVNAARAVSMAGGTPAPSDTTPPTVSISSPVAGATVSGTISVQAAATDNVGVSSVSLSIDGTLLTADTATPYSFVWNTFGVLDGTHTLTVTASDAAGNKATAQITVTVSNSTRDTTPPSVSISSPAAGITVSGTVPVQVAASDNVGVSSVSLSVDGTLLGTDTTLPYNFSWNTAAAVNGIHTLTATASDAAGNKATAQITVTVGNSTPDTTPPTVSITSPAAGATVSGTVAIQAAASDNVGVSSVSLSVDGTLLGTDTASPYNFSWNTTGATNGTHTVTAKANDAAGNTSSAQISVTVSNSAPDTTPPTVSISSPSAGAAVSGTVSVQVAASDNVGVSSVSLTVDGTLLGTDTASPYGFSWNTAGVANGAHTLTATASDAAGNRASASVLVTVSNSTLDTTPPSIGITSPVSGATVSGVVSVQVSAMDNVGVVKVELYVDGVLKGTSTTAPFSMNWNTRRIASGAHTLQCKAYDAAGNVGTSAPITVYK